MLPRSLLALCALLAVAAPAAAADTTVATDPVAQSVTALDGTVVWVSGKYGHQTLMQHTAAGDAPVPGAPESRGYASIDLGHDASGGLVLTYLRCEVPSRCVALRDDLAGHRSSLRRLAPKGCSLSAAPALWGKRVAYGLACKSRSRSGLFVDGRRLPLPKQAIKYGADLLTSVDLRGTRVAAVAADVYEYAFTETVNGTHQRSILSAASEGDSDEHTRGLALGTGGALWALVDSEHVGDPNEAVIHRIDSTCEAVERLANPPGPDEESGYRATDLAVDGAAIYLVVPGTGIVAHDDGTTCL